MLILIAGWACYFALHSLLAALRIKTWFHQKFPKVPARYYRLFYNLFFLIGLIILIYYQIIVPSGKLFEPGGVVKLIAGIISFGGLVIMIVAISNYDTKSFLGITEMRSQSLQVKGLNKYMRHPLYTGTSIFLIGLFLIIPYYKHFYFLILYFVYLIIGIWLEEKKLVRLYGNEYRQYQQKVKKLIPKLW